MIEIINPGWLSLIVDRGRYGYGEAGVPPSSGLDAFACTACKLLVGQDDSAPLIEGMGPGFSFRAGADVTVAVTGAKALLGVGKKEYESWSSFIMRKGDSMTVHTVLEGFRYYVGFSGLIDVPLVMGSFSTNLECRFGGFEGRPLAKGDRLKLRDLRSLQENTIPHELIPDMTSPHRIHILDGPEKGHFAEDSWGTFCNSTNTSCYTVSSKLNRTGIRLQGDPLLFREGVKESIVSEGVLPGTVQVPADGMPIIVLFERTAGGYARVGVVAESDLDRCAHLKPGDQVLFERTSIEDAGRLHTAKTEAVSRLLNQVRRLP